VPGWRKAADPYPLALFGPGSAAGIPDATAVTTRRVVRRALLRGPETRPVPDGEPGIPGFNAQLGSPIGTAAPDFTAPDSSSSTPAATPAPSAPAQTDWWFRG